MTQVYAVFDGIRYRWNGWGGCQLESLEWRRPPAGTTRILEFENGKPSIMVTVFSTERKGLFRRCRCTWAVSKSGSYDECSERIKELKDALRGLW